MMSLRAVAAPVRRQCYAALPRAAAARSIQVSPSCPDLESRRRLLTDPLSAQGQRFYSDRVAKFTGAKNTDVCPPRLTPLPLLADTYPRSHENDSTPSTPTTTPTSQFRCM
ncbi:hypothetical protein F5Y18DRAFT_45436 [Xylariaceae sp. FL1019]|nr:hypothetical protein F5Y18DRAFT_45436 [Xylariaceae sp. FL1019]